MAFRLTGSVRKEFCGPIAALCVALAGAAPAPAAELGGAELARLALARAQGMEAVTVSMVTSPGAARTLARDLRRRGARILFVAPQVDFTAAVVPLEELAALVGRAEVYAAGIDLPAGTDATWNTLVNYGAPSDAVGEGEGAEASPGTGSPVRLVPLPVPAGNRVLDDINAAGWRRRHPDFDGRGVVIAQVEAAPDLLSPELQQARNREGAPVRKLRDLVTLPAREQGLVPEQDLPDWREVVLSGAGIAGPETASVPVLPEALRAERRPLLRGTLRVPLNLLERSAPGVAARGSDAAIESGELPSARSFLPGPNPGTARAAVPARDFLFLWHPGRGQLWFDRNDDGSLADELPVRPFGMSGEVIELGIDLAHTPQRETLALAFAPMPGGRSLMFTPGDLGGHATMVAGSAAASASPAGLLDGVAPGAQLIAFDRGRTILSFARTLIAAFSDPRTDLVLIEGYSPATTRSLGNAGLLPLLLDRLVREHGKLAIVTAGNTPGLSSADDICLARLAICVGAWQSQATTLINEGIDIGAPERLHWVGSTGPGIGGMLKPDLLAPANNVVIDSGNLAAWPLPTGLYAPRPGYRVGAGTSNATPIVAGAAALLIGAARQAGVPHDWRLVRRAMLASARFVPTARIAAHDQGRGLLDLNAAWGALGAIAGEPVEIEVRGQAGEDRNTVQAASGLFERDGVPAGGAVRTLTVTRYGGPAEPVTYTLDLRGDNASFRLSDRITLPRGRRVPLSIRIAPGSPGAHSALLTFTADGAAVRSGEAGLAVIFPHLDPLTPRATRNDRIVAEPAERPSWFVRVPPGADAIWFRANEERQPAEWVVADPAGNSAAYYHFHRQGGQETAAGIAFAAPASGTWQIMLPRQYDFRRRYDWAAAAAGTWRANIDFEARIIDVEIAPGPGGLCAMITNSAAPVVAGLASGANASLGETRLTLQPLGHHVADIEILPGATLLGAELDPITGAEALDAGLYLFHCPVTRPCTLSRRAQGSAGRRRVLVWRPAPGRWRVVVQAGTRGEAGAFHYRDYWTHPQFGLTVSTDPVVPRPSGAAWAARLDMVAPTVQPGPGRAIAQTLYLEAAELQSTHSGYADTETAQGTPQRVGSVPLGLTLLRSRLTSMSGAFPAITEHSRCS